MDKFLSKWDKVNEMTTIEQLETILSFLKNGGKIDELVLGNESIPAVCHEVVMTKN